MTYRTLFSTPNPSKKRKILFTYFLHEVLSKYARTLKANSNKNNLGYIYKTFISQKFIPSCNDVYQIYI